MERQIDTIMRVLPLHLLVNRKYTLNHKIIQCSKSTFVSSMQLLCSMLHQATIFAACCTLTRSSTFYDKQFDITRENDNWLKYFRNIPNSFATLS